MGAAGPLLTAGGQQRVKGPLIGAAREQLLTIDQVEQGHGLAGFGDAGGLGRVLLSTLATFVLLGASHGPA